MALQCDRPAAAELLAADLALKVLLKAHSWQRVSIPLGMLGIAVVTELMHNMQENLLTELRLIFFQILRKKSVNHFVKRV